MKIAAGARSSPSLCVAAVLVALVGALACVSGRERAPAWLWPVHLRCEYYVDPLGVDVPRPNLSWELGPGAAAGEQRGLRQTAYQVRAATTTEQLERGQPDLWDSGRVESAATIQVAYDGEALASGQQVFWQVRVWD